MKLISFTRGGVKRLKYEITVTSLLRATVPVDRQVATATPIYRMGSRGSSRPVKLTASILRRWQSVFRKRRMEGRKQKKKKPMTKQPTKSTVERDITKHRSTQFCWGSINVAPLKGNCASLTCWNCRSVTVTVW